MNPAHNPNLHPLSALPTGMEHDPNADEEIIDQTQPAYSEETDLEPAAPVGRIPSQIADDPAQDEDLSNKIAYALDGSEPIPPSDPGEVRKVRSEGVTGASLDEEEANLKS